MKTKATIVEVSRIAEIIFDGLTPDKAKERVLMMLKHDPERINFKLPGKGKDVVIDVCQIE
jgi:hypothetical protein